MALYVRQLGQRRREAVAALDHFQLFRDLPANGRS